MEPSIQDIVDLVTVTVGDMYSDSFSVQISGDNILVNNNPVPLSEIMANRYSAKEFMDLIRSAL